MLQELRIKNYALIDDVVIPFKDGFTTITGETGAGKSIMLGALSLLLGNRADTSVLKDDSVKSVVEAVFQVEAYQLQKLFAEYDVDYEHETVIRREITPAGKSRSFVNDTPVTLQFLRELGVHLIEVHSQNSNLALNDPSFQMEVVDLLADNAKLLPVYKAKYAEYKTLKKELSTLKSSAQSMKDDAEYKQYLYTELHALALKEGELADLEQEYELQSHAEEVTNSVMQTISAIEAEGTGVSALLTNVIKPLTEAGQFNSSLKDLAERLQSAIIEIADIGNELQRLEPSFEHDPQRSEYLRNRLDTVFNLQQKHKVATEKELLAVYRALEQDLAITGDLDGHIELLSVKIEKANEELTVQATRIRANRDKIIPKIEKNIVILLRNLGIANAEFKIERTDRDDFAPDGADDVVFLFSANKSSVLRPVTETASGGEISRIMLCLKSIISKSKRLPSIIFDEIDVGVSGDIAEKMAFIMREMSENMQVVTITHLPQIASKGAHHFTVFKKDTAHSTNTHITLLDENQRIEEVAKMLSGKELTEAALQNAAHLIRS